jgi:hypothetical protein
MPPQKTQLSCPRCHQPIVAQIEQLFDITSDPGSKQRFLGNVSNFAICQHCGFNGPLATPIVYHDAAKELLLTYFPGELGVSVNEQEKILGPLITQTTNRLPPEKRKAYLLRPQSFLSYQSLVERVLGADGITPEMIKEQQQRVSLIERLLGAPNLETRSGILKQDTVLIDAEFFAIFNRLMESARVPGGEKTSQALDEIQKQLLTETEYGRKIVSQTAEIQEAMKTLQSAGKELDRDKLLKILIDAPNDDRLNALVSFTRPGLDYLFFQSLTERIEKESGETRKKLEGLREKLLDATHMIDQHAEEELKHAKALLDSILSSENIQQATTDHLNDVGEVFIQLLNQTLQEANKKNDAVLMPKLQQVVAVLQQASTPPPELALLEEMLDAPDEIAVNALVEKHAAEITPDFSSIVASVISRTEEQAKGKSSGEETKLLDKLQMIYRAVLKNSMKTNLG